MSWVFFNLEYFPCLWLPNLIPIILYFKYTFVVDFQSETVIILLIFCLPACWGTRVPMSINEPLRILGFGDLAAVGKCPEIALAHPFIFQNNLKILPVGMFCLSEQYSALNGLTVDHVKGAVRQF